MYTKIFNVLITIDKNILINCALKFFKMIEEIQGDLFIESDPMSSLAHCVAKDLALGAGIAVQFKKRFKGMVVFPFSIIFPETNVVIAISRFVAVILILFCSASMRMFFKTGRF